MLSTVRGVFRDGHVELEEPPPKSVARVLVTFLPEEEPPRTVSEPATTRDLGFAAGQVTLHPAFFEPLPEEVLRGFEGKSA